MQRASPGEAEALVSQFNRLTDMETEQGMGRTYQVLSIAHAAAPLPAGFETGPSHVAGQGQGKGSGEAQTQGGEQGQAGQGAQGA